MSRGFGAAQRLILRYLMDRESQGPQSVSAIVDEWASRKRGLCDNTCLASTEWCGCDFGSDEEPTRTERESVNRAIRWLSDRQMAFVIVDYGGYHGARMVMLTSGGLAAAESISTPRRN